MRILQLGKFYPPDFGGIETLMQDICDALSQRGIVCDVLCSNSKLQSKKEKTPYGATIYRTPSFGKVASTSITPQMITTLRKLISSYDIIHLHFPDPMAVLALFLSPHKNKTIILHWHSDIIKQKFLLNFFLPLQKWILNRSNLIITTSENYIHQSPFLSPYKNKCIAIPIGIHLPEISPSNNYSKDYNRILSVGRLVPLKGFEYLIESLQYLPKNFYLEIVGDGIYKQTLQDLIKRLNLQNRVFLVGKKTKEEISSFYAQSGIFVLPSLQESYGIVLVEALSFGLPIISTKLIPSGSDFINQDGKTGLVVPPKDPRAIANSILKISKNYDFFSINARCRYEKLFTKNQMIQTLVDTYHKLI
ncbi:MULTISPECIES: glycosyltransferase [unclassified Helicobacter]|uniref:glycosyltransferase n=1 Tax=unclassified Helicobacter TaxID=2593540 RepID=UPI000CF1AD45|nr:MULTISPECIES: glycosyltransferase [unclassified Helicobacter]